MDKEERIKELFNKTKVSHGIKCESFQDIREKARKEWLSTHDRFLSIEEIDAVIDEYRRNLDEKS